MPNADDDQTVNLSRDVLPKPPCLYQFSSLSILSLPPEILVLVYEQPIWDDWKEILRLAHVSRELRAIAIATPQLWAR